MIDLIETEELVIPHSCNDDRPHYLLINAGDGMLEILQRMEFPVISCGGCLGFRYQDRDQYIKALQFLYELQIIGWWRQERAMVELGICTKKEFDRYKEIEMHRGRGLVPPTR